MRTIPPVDSYEAWQRNALNYLEVLKGTGALPPGPSHFLVRFRGRRPSVQVTPEWFRRHLARCRQTSQHVSPSTGLHAHWTCAGPGILGRTLVLALGGYGDRIAEAVVWVDQLPPRST